MFPTALQKVQPGRFQSSKLPKLQKHGIFSSGPKAKKAVKTVTICSISLYVELSKKPSFKRTEAKWASPAPHRKRLVLCIAWKRHRLIWPPAHHLLHCWDSPHGTPQPQEIPKTASITAPVVFLGGAAFACQTTTSHQSKHHSLTRVAKVRSGCSWDGHVPNFTHPNWDFRRYFSTARWPCD